MSEAYVIAKVTLINNDESQILKKIDYNSQLRISFHIDDRCINSIDRSFGRFMEFYASIRKAHNLPDTLKLETLGGNVGLVTSKTERYLTSLFDILGDSYWKDIEVIQFIDENVEISDLTNECISCLSSKVAALERQVNEWKESMKKTQSNISRLQQVQEKEDRNAKVRAFLMGDDDDPLPSSPAVPSSSSGRSSESDEFNENAPMPLFMIRRHLPHQNSSNSQISCETDRESVSVFGSSLTDAYCQDNALPSSTFLPGELINIILKNHIYEEAVEDVLKMISTSQHLVHVNDVNYLSSHIKTILFVKTFDIGLHAIGFSLSDDEIKLLLIPEHTSNEPFDKQVANLLRSLSHTHSTSNTNIHKKSNAHLGNEMNKDFESVDYSLSFNPQHQKPGSLVGMLNGHTSFSLVFQDETEAALLLMFEEINHIIGKDDLFKKSVMLIRAWWINESVIYVGASIKHYLPNTAFMVMVVAVFNKFHQTIQTPFQALCLFLAEFALYNPATQWITMDGFVDSPVAGGHGTSATSSVISFPTSATSISGQAAQANNLLFDQHFVQKYKDIARVQTAHQQNMESGSNGNSNDSIYVLPLESPPMSTASSGKHHSSSGVHIINPLNGNNMATEKLTANQVIRLTKALQNGAANLSVFIRQIEDGQNNTPKQAALIKNFFPNIVSATTTASTKPEIRVKMGRSSEEMRKDLLACIAYNNFISKGIVTSEVLIAITVSILQEKGGLRTKEIEEEMMMKLSSIAREVIVQNDLNILTSLRQALHEKSNELFVIVEDDPENPHIILQETLTPQQLAMVARGTVSVQSLIQLSKANVANSRAMLLDNSSNSNGSSNHGMMINNVKNSHFHQNHQHFQGHHNNQHQMRGNGAFHNNNHSNFSNNNNRGTKPTMNMMNMGMGNMNKSMFPVNNNGNGMNFQQNHGFGNNRGGGGGGGSFVQQQQQQQHQNYHNNHSGMSMNMNNNHAMGGNNNSRGNNRRGSSSGHFAPNQGLSRQNGQLFRGGFSLNNSNDLDISPTSSFVGNPHTSASNSFPGNNTGHPFGTHNNLMSNNVNRFSNNPRLAALGLTGNSNTSNTPHTSNSNSGSRLFGDDLLRSMSGSNFSDSSMSNNNSGTSSNPGFSLLGNNSLSENWLDGLK